MKTIAQLLLFIFFIFPTSIIAQNINELRDQGLITNVNTLVLNQNIQIDILAQNNMIVKKRRKVLVLNEFGLKNIDAYQYYDDKTKIKELRLEIFQLNNLKPHKVIKEKDFKDLNASDGFSVVTDNRVKTANYQHTISYPFIADFTSEYVTSNTAHIPGFHPYVNTYENSLSLDFQINYNSDLGFQYLNKNFNDQEILVSQTPNSITYQAKNLIYQEKEAYSQSYSNAMPHAVFGLQKFNLEGVNGEITSWKDFGKWYHSNFIVNNQELSPQTVEKVKQLTNHLTDPIEKARVLYAYMQSKTRYISIQLGIGGWKPFPAKYVDQKGFGDCKALSNYMAALLKVANVDSYVTIVNAGNSIEDINEDLVSLQGNHMILAIPQNNDYIFLECTSQTTPFSFITNFTDGRKVIIVKPDEAIIYKTPLLQSHQNFQHTKATIKVDNQGAIQTNILVKNSGEFYDMCEPLSRYDQEEMMKNIKKRYDLIRDISTLQYELKDNKKDIIYTESYNVKTNPVVKKMGNQYILPVNIIHPLVHIPKKYQNRKFDFAIERGYTMIDEYEIELPNDISFTFVPESKNLKTEFGDYQLNISVDVNKIKVYRKFELASKTYNKTQYDQYKKFREEIAQLESTKLTYKL